MKRILLGSIVAASLLAGLGLRPAGACPMCKDSISDTAKDGTTDGRGGSGAIPVGFNWSVYYMLFGLFATGGLVLGVITKGIRNADAEQLRRGFPIDKRPSTEKAGEGSTRTKE